MIGQLNARILSHVRQMLEDGRHDPYVCESDGNEIVVRDIAVVTCFYGLDEKRLVSTKYALSLFDKYKARPNRVVLVEAQYDESDARLGSFAQERGFQYMFVKLGEGQRGIYVKQALLNIATRSISEDKIVYLDSDIGFCNTYWVKNVSLLLDNYGITQPFSHAYFAYINGEEPVRNKIEQSAIKRFVDFGDRTFMLVTGFAWAMTRRAFEQLGGMEVLSSPSEDVWFWHMTCSMTSNRLSGLPYQLFLDDCTNRKCTDVKVGFGDEVCFHVEHGTSASRRYAAYVYACNRQNPDPLCDVDYDKSGVGLPKWKDDVWAKIRKRTVELIGLDSDDLHQDYKSTKARASLAIEKANLEAFGPLLKDVKVVTILDDAHSPADVQLHKSLFEKFMAVDFEYVCLSNGEIKGVNTIRRTSGLPKRFDVVDVFRKDVSGDGCICLYASLDVIPTNKIELCNVPDMFIGLNNPRHSGKFEGAWILYLCNSMLFSGDFSFVYDNYVADNGAMSQRKRFINPENAIAYNLYREGIDIRAMSQFIDIRNVRLGRLESYQDYAVKVQELVDEDERIYTQLASGNIH